MREYFKRREIMEGKFKKGKEVLVEKLELPKDVILDIPKIIVMGRNEITIEKAEAITDNIILIIFNKSTFNHLKYNITIKRKEFQYAWRNNQKNAFRARLVLL